MNRHQRMKNRETARRLRQWLSAPAISIGIDHGTPGGDLSAVTWVSAGRVLSCTFHGSTSADFLRCSPDRRFWPVKLTHEGGPT